MDLFKLVSLKILNLSQNYITEIPSGISSLKNLKYLNLSQNNLKNVPQSIYEMKELECLLLSRNKLKTIPTKLYMLNLYQLDLSFNLISEIPIKTAQNLARITIVDLSNNPINDPPLQVIFNSI